MSVVLCTLALNEMEFLPALYEQHRAFPELAAWVFVEAADRAYHEANPSMVTPEGLSVDGTSAFLRNLAAEDRRVTYIPHGFSSNADPAKGKCEARGRYLEIVNRHEPEFFLTVDADEFYTKRDQAELLRVMRELPGHGGYIFPKREIWRSPWMAQEGWREVPCPYCFGTKTNRDYTRIVGDFHGIPVVEEQPCSFCGATGTVPDDPAGLLDWEVVGGFWGIPCCHWWRWQPGLHHRDCHNTPTRADGLPLNETAIDVRDLKDRFPELPQMLHLGFAAGERTRLAKNRYYEERGEKTDGYRSWYVESRSAWKDWRPGVQLPRGAEVVEYTGPVPEVFQA